MIRLLPRWIGCGVLMLGCCASAAYGQAGFGLGFYNYGSGYGINYRQPPYYALFPPVYYSYPVPRPYGYSPFAYPPGTITPDVKPNLGAAEYLNPYVPSPSSSSSATDRTAGTGKFYVNPFVKQAAGAGNQALAKRAP
jgi:hypothetical protein